MSLRNIDVSAALTRVAERKIEEAMRAGKFDHLEGAGKPLDLEPMPADEKARLMWWALRLLKRNDVVPDEVQLRKTIAVMRESLARAPDEATVRQRVVHINGLVRRLNTLGTHVLPSEIRPLDAEIEIARWRAAARPPQERQP